MQYDDALRYLLSLGHETLALKLGLRTTERLLHALADPQTSFPSVQIAGTNGKGSTAVVLASICDTAGVRTGLFTSPHLINITERIKIAGQEISRATFAELATTVRESAEELVRVGELDAAPTYFEQVTAIALLAFRQARIELAILETGLGGRLDSTTAAGAEVVAITPIALDHQEYLGETLMEIAGEKAAIIRPHVTAIVAAQAQPALDVIMDRCKTVNVIPQINGCDMKVRGSTNDGRMRADFKTSQDHYPEVVLGLRGRHQLTNVALAIQIAEALRERGFQISHHAIVHGIEEARHPGRLELWEDDRARPQLLFDGAHNPAGVAALAEYLGEFVKGPVTFIFGAMREKNLAEMARLLFPLARRLILTRPDNPRSAEPEVLSGFIPDSSSAQTITIEPSPGIALKCAYEQTPAEGLICVTGSLYLVGEIQAALRQNPREQVAQPAQRN